MGQRQRDQRDTGPAMGRISLEAHKKRGLIYFNFVELIGVSRLDQRDAGPNWGRNVSGVRWVCFAPVRGDNGHDRSFITRDYNRGRGKENGTIPF